MHSTVDQLCSKLRGDKVLLQRMLRPQPLYVQAHRRQYEYKDQIRECDNQERPE